MWKSVAQVVLLVLALVFGSALVHLGVGLLTGQLVANRMKEYEQRWKVDDARILKLEEEITQLEKKRDELHAAAKKEMIAAVSVTTEGMKREAELRSRPLTPEDQAAANGTRAITSEKLGKGIAKGKLSWGEAKRVGKDEPK